MSNELVAIDIRLNQDPAALRPGDQVRGEITLVPQVEVGFNHFGYKVVMRIRGKLSPGEWVAHEEILMRDIRLQPGQEQSFPISFEAPEALSYQGRNVSFEWQLESVLDYDSETDAQIRGKSLKKLQLLKVFHPERGSGKILPLTLATDTVKYAVTDTGVDPSYLFSGSKGLWGAVGIMAVLVIIGSSITSDFFENALISWAIGIGALLLIGGGVAAYYYFAKSVLGKVEVNVSQREEGYFELNVGVEKNVRSIRAAEVWYEVREKVIDDRGTSSTTYNSCLFTSEKIPWHARQEDQEISMRLPDAYYPYTTARPHVTLYWVVKFRANIGVPYTYEKEIRVSRPGDTSVQWP